MQDRHPAAAAIFARMVLALPGLDLETTRRRDIPVRAGTFGFERFERFENFGLQTLEPGARFGLTGLEVIHCTHQQSSSWDRQ